MTDQPAARGRTIRIEASAGELIDRLRRVNELLWDAEDEVRAW